MIADATVQSQFLATPACEIRSASDRTPTVGELAERFLKQQSTRQVSQSLPLDVIRKPDGSLTAVFGRSVRSATAALKTPNPGRADHFDQVRDQRIALLARRFAESKYSGEDRARFAILTEQARALRPKVTAADMAALNEQAARIQDASDELDQIAAEFDL